MQQQANIIENLFRFEYGKIMAILVNKFGPAHLESIEDAMQDALLKAMQIWGYKDVPQNPTSWLLGRGGEHPEGIRQRAWCRSRSYPPLPALPSL